jgi:two-component system KDP operon response regulator KdpE
MKDQTRVLVVDDDLRYVWSIQTDLEAQGYQVFVAQDGRTAIELAANTEPDLIVLEARLPGQDGYTVCQHIRKFSAAPIIMLARRAGSADKVRGLGLGADDFVAKPFSSRVFLARVKAVLRRGELVQWREPALGF